MECPEFLPLGSICSVRGNTKKLMVIARGLALQQDGAMRYFDYGGCLWPEGLIGDQLLYFNHDAIQRVIHEGYEDEEEQLQLEALAKSLKQVSIERGDPDPVKHLSPSSG